MTMMTVKHQTEVLSKATAVVVQRGLGIAESFQERVDLKEIRQARLLLYCLNAMDRLGLSLKRHATFQSRNYFLLQRSPLISRKVTYFCCVLYRTMHWPHTQSCKKKK